MTIKLEDLRPLLKPLSICPECGKETIELVECKNPTEVFAKCTSCGADIQFVVMPGIKPPSTGG
jgi:transcription elongation factor Elf1